MEPSICICGDSMAIQCAVMGFPTYAPTYCSAKDLFLSLNCGIFAFVSARVMCVVEGLISALVLIQRSFKEVLTSNYLLVIDDVFYHLI